jgi:membrane-associated phospholipid phosphatase
MSNLKYIFYDWGGLNKKIFLFLNPLFENSPLITTFLMNFSFLGTTYPVVILYFTFMLAVCINLWIKRNIFTEKELFKYCSKWFEVFFVIGASAVTLHFIMPVLKKGFNFSRPICHMDISKINIIIEYGYDFASMYKKRCLGFDFSFPSAHTTIITLFIAGFWPIVRKFHGKILLISLPVIMGVSRIATGVHFPADILGGSILATTVVITVRFLFRKLKRFINNRKTIEELKFILH